MQITHLGHAAVLVDSGSERILIDPGNFSSAWHSVMGLDAIVITHLHPDHVDEGHLPAVLDANPGAAVLAEPQTVEKLGLDRAEEFRAGTQRQIGGVKIQAIGGIHAEIHPDIARIGNIGLIVSAPNQPTFFHPGDSLAEIPEGIDVLAVPAYGPWAAIKETIDFVRQVGAPQGFLIHEGLLHERGVALIRDRISQLSSTTLIDLRDGKPYDFGG